MKAMYLDKVSRLTSRILSLEQREGDEDLIRELKANRQRYWDLLDTENEDS